MIKHVYELKPMSMREGFKWGLAFGALSVGSSLVKGTYVWVLNKIIKLDNNDTPVGEEVQNDNNDAEEENNI